MILRGKQLVNFASCSYLGLEVDARVKEGAIHAVERYGTFFSSSRACLRSPLYRELEERLDRIFGALVFHDSTLRQRVQSCGGPQIFSGQLAPAVLGAAITSADIHLSQELPWLQQELSTRIAQTRSMLHARDIAPVCGLQGPIVFVGTFKLEVSMEVAGHLQDEGFWVNVAGFPATPRNGAGLRLTLSNHVNADDITALCDSLTHHLPRALDKFRPATKRVGDAPAYKRVTHWPMAA